MSTQFQGLHILSASLVSSLERKRHIHVPWHTWCLGYSGCSRSVAGSNWTGGPMLLLAGVSSKGKRSGTEVWDSQNVFWLTFSYFAEFGFPFPSIYWQVNVSFLSKKKQEGQHSTYMMWIYLIPGHLSRRVQKRELTYKIGCTGQYKASANFMMSSLLKKSQQKLTIV